MWLFGDVSFMMSALTNHPLMYILLAHHLPADQGLPAFHCHLTIHKGLLVTHHCLRP
jgi:hypothetical protein